MADKLKQSKCSKLQSFNIGDDIDVYSGKDKAWMIAKVIELKQYQIKIQFYTWNSKWNIWFDKQSKLIAKLHTYSLPIVQLQTPPEYTQQYFYNLNTCKKPILHKRNFIICGEDGIFKYDISNDKYVQIIAYENQSKTIAYDARNELLYITNGKSSFDILDLQNNALQSKKISNHFFYSKNLLSIVINHDPGDDCYCYSNNYQHKDVLHIFAFISDAKCYHLYLNIDKQQIVLLQTIHPLIKGNILFIPHQKRILLFGQEIYEFYTKTNKNHRAKFVKCKDIKMPKFIGKRYTILNVYQSLIAMIIPGEKILFFDLLSNKWFCSDAQIPIVSINTHIMDGKDNYVYYIKYAEYDKRFFFKIHWNDVIPKKLRKLYKDNMHRSLVYGLIRAIETSHNFPFYLKELVLLYFPSFCYF